MRRQGWIGLLLIQVASGLAVGRLETTSEQAITSNFIFRGAARGPAGIVSDSRVRYDLLGGWSFGAEHWRYLQLSNAVGVGETRTGANIGYQASRWVRLTGGYRHYSRRERPGRLFQGPDTQEVYLGTTFQVPGSPSLTLYYDLDGATGAYLEATAHQTLALGGSGWQAEVRGLIGFDSGRTDGFSAAAVGVDLRRAIGAGWRLGPSVDLWFPASRVDPNQHARAVVSGQLEYRRQF